MKTSLMVFRHVYFMPDGGAVFLSSATFRAPAGVSAWRRQQPLSSVLHTSVKASSASMWTELTEAVCGFPGEASHHHHTLF